MQLSEHQRLFLAAVCDYFHVSATWPTYGLLDRDLSKSHEGLDVEEIGDDLDAFMHDSGRAPRTGWDATRQVIMNISALHTCQVEDIYPAIVDDLDAFVNLVVFCVDRYEVGGEDVYVTAAEIRDNFGIAGDMLLKLYQLVLVEGFFTTSNGGQNEDWAFKLPGNIRKYRGVATVEDYIATREKALNRRGPRLVYTGPPPGMQQSNWMPSLLSQYKVVGGDSAEDPTKSNDLQQSIADQAHLDSMGTALVPMELVDGTRGYIEKVAGQVNRTYAAQCYDACAVMLRRLIETLIIEAFEAYHIADKIKVSGNFVPLDELVDKILAETSWNLGRTVKKELRQLKDVGNRSAHDRRYNATKSDIDKIASDVRGVVGELVALRP